MKGRIENMTSKADWRAQSACVGIRSQDYLVTTMKMRERVQTARCNSQGKTYRKTIRTLRSAPPFQNRNLDNYPMPHSREDAVRLAKGSRLLKRDTARRMMRERTDSGLLRDYSKQMFDFTVRNVSNPNIIRHFCDNADHSPGRSKSGAKKVSRKTNGPTSEGSALHNRRQQVLNSIRIRPHPDDESRFKHERATSSLSVQHAINDKNRQYRVRSVAECTRPGSIIGNSSLAGSDFVFIPMDQSSENSLSPFRSDITDMRNQRRNTQDIILSEYTDEDSLDAVFGKDLFDEEEDRTSSICGHVKNSNAHQPRRLSHLLPPEISCNLHLVSLDDASSSDSEAEKEEPPQEMKKPEPPPPVKSTARGKKQVKVVVEEEKKLPEPDPEPEPVKVKIVLKGPHCWVDDATITSESSVDIADDSPDGEKTQPTQPEDNVDKSNGQKQENNGKTKMLAKLAVNANNKSLGGTFVKQTNNQTMKDAFEKAIQDVQSKPNDITDNVNNAPDVEQMGNLIVNADEKADHKEKEPEVVLPPFICPSSEKKSREAALKDWLAHTCFRSGYKGLPVV